MKFHLDKFFLLSDPATISSPRQRRGYLETASAIFRDPCQILSNLFFSLFAASARSLISQKLDSSIISHFVTEL